ncbi:MAG: ribonuclease P protein component [Ignavibacteria bacterium]|nr:ribonuclease P protein component [Ignavibacteria bacterium]MBT8381499.1 ribonuclease P protein component [Ignavibacteria bacterium]MBT8391561.1 ribonuclease P protein component [Ignavibacteria bacterium]NNJ52253.1 ribonuclease P protein component [Ignavibacteriaceae bacterium]NNL22730.1 ribonuclease P protein component [Ignavibacteriaceae bacterium]
MLLKTDNKHKRKLKSKKAIEEIFNSGKVVYSPDKKYRAHYLLHSNTDEFGVKFSVAVSKKAGNAVWRNRVKRLIRETNRLCNKELNDCCLQNKVELKIVFATNKINEKNSRKISLTDTQPPIEEILKRIKSGITSS